MGHVFCKAARTGNRFAIARAFSQKIVFSELSTVSAETEIWSGGIRGADIDL